MVGLSAYDKLKIFNVASSDVRIYSIQVNI